VHINRGLVFWGVALITAGVIALASQVGWIDSAVVRDLWRFWPIALIVIGLAVIASRTQFALIATLVAGLVVGGLAGALFAGFPQGITVGCGGTPDQTKAVSGLFGGASADVDLELNCGELRVTTASGADWDVDARYAGDNAPNITSSDGSLHVSADEATVFGFADERQEWDVVLPTEVDLNLEVSANAAETDLALDDASFGELNVDANAGSVVIGLPGGSVDDLSVDANAGSISLTADDGTTLAGSVSMNAGSFDLCVPDDVGVAITISEEDITFSHNLDESNLTRNGDTWSGGPASATSDAAITLDVSGNAASFTFNPDGGCS
jgi:cell wall-active antibiotic response 4TMS protein YvqF